MLLKLLLNSAVGLDRSHSPSMLCLQWQGQLPSPTSSIHFACSKGFIEYYTEGSVGHKSWSSYMVT